MKRKIALVTGATSGIGKAFAERFALMGYDLLLTGRRAHVLRGVAGELEKAHRITATVIIAELNNEKGIRTVLAAIKKSGGIDILVNNAGYGIEGIFISLPVQEHLDMVSVHINATLRFIHAALPRMLARKNGVIINVASMAAFLPAPINGIYGGSKAFLTILTESLHLEVRRSGVRVQALCPGFTLTDFHRKMGVEAELNNNRNVFWMTPERVADISLRCLKKGKTICIPGFRNKIVLFIARIMPRRLYYLAIEKLYGEYLD
jgi:short-subunit dehydrogenase